MRRRPPHLIELSEQDQQLFEDVVQDGRVEQRVARRARILLAMTDPATVVEQLADKVEVTRVAIWQLCRRYEELGLDAVFDAPRAGRPWEISPLGARRD
jgi:biotin operon repressor